MTNRYLYEHAVTGKVGSYNETFAAVFGDRLIRVDSEGGSTETTKKRSSRKTNDSDSDSNTDSSEGGN